MASSTSATPFNRATYIRGAAWGIFAISIWVGWIIFTRYGVTSKFSPYDIIAMRFACAGILLLPLALRESLLTTLRQIGWRTFLVIVAGAGVPYVLVASSGLAYAPAAHAGALVPGTMPLWTALFSMWLLKERISGLRKIGLAMIPLGIIVILGSGLTDFSTGYWKGHLLFLCGAGLWASFTVAMRASGLTPLRATAIVSVVSAIVYLPIYILFLPHRIAEAPLSAVIAQTVFQGVFVSIISLLAYGRAVTILGASLGASFASLVPVLAMLAAIPLLGEIPATHDVFGIITITLGVFLASGAYAIFKQRDSAS